MLKAVCQNTLPFHSHRDITARFDGGSLTSDAGWLLFGSLDRQHRLCEGFSSCISESRDRRYVRHDLLKLIRQRVLQIVAGYEDCNDADTLRSDPMLKTVCDQLPESDPDLATQPTFSRLENSVTKKDLMRLSQWLLGLGGDSINAILIQTSIEETFMVKLSLAVLFRYSTIAEVSMLIKAQSRSVEVKQDNTNGRAAAFRFPTVS